jgi:hypothetical protein
MKCQCDASAGVCCAFPNVASEGNGRRVCNFHYIQHMEQTTTVARLIEYSIIYFIVQYVSSKVYDNRRGRSITPARGRTIKFRVNQSWNLLDQNNLGVGGKDGDKQLGATRRMCTRVLGGVFQVVSHL